MPLEPQMAPSSQMQTCRVVGLTSAKGQTLNGSAAEAQCDPHGAVNVRVPVLIDGAHGGPVALLRSNLLFPSPTRTRKAGIGVGRGSIRDTDFAATAVDNATNRMIAQVRIAGGRCRCRGNLIAVEAHVKEARQVRGKEDIVIICTDLNVARAVNLVATGGDADLAPPCDELLSKVKKPLREVIRRGATVIAKFDSHRISRDGIDPEKRWGEGRSSAVLAGAFKVYPCPCERYLDAMEVRFVDSITKSGRLIVRHETYLDYGPEEAAAYMLNAAALNETERLSPSALAQVDPQAFWAAVLHIDRVMEAIESIGGKDLFKQWEGLVQGVTKSREIWREGANKSGTKLPPSVVAGDNFEFQISTEKEHKKIATECATVALMMMINTSGLFIKNNAASADPAEKEVSPLTIETLDWYKGTELDRMVMSFSHAAKLEADHVAKGKKLKQKHRDQYLNHALSESGFGEEVADIDPLAQCGHCKKTPAKKKELKICARCDGVAYCCRECQTAAWKKHKRDCNPIVAQGRKMMRDLEGRGAKITTSMYKPRSTLPTVPCMLTEASGTGTVGIFWNPGGASAMNCTDIEEILTLTGGDRSIAVIEYASMTMQQQLSSNNGISFQSLSDLPAAMRFLLSCGPLSDITIARASLDETLDMIGDIRQVYIRAAGFTALEWAAKKGNKETVNWLCTDTRTKALVEVGCPVGWACYTGHVDIAKVLVSHGADASKTSSVLWGGMPPLHVAAQNGKVEAMKYLVDDLGQDIYMKDPSGKDIIKSIKVQNWRDLPDQKRALKWAKSKMG